RRSPPRTRPAGPPPRPPHTRPAGPPPRPPPARPSRLAAPPGSASRRYARRGGMARRAAHPTSRQPAAASRNRGDRHVQPVAHAPLLFQIHAFAGNTVREIDPLGPVRDRRRRVGQAWEAGG